MASGDNTTSLMFGVQWNLVLKFLETKGMAETQINTDSSSWGNYYYSSYDLTNPSAKYNLYDTSTNVLTLWQDAPYSKKENKGALLTTAASSLFRKQNISDLAGNLWEWTLEYSSSTGDPCTMNGGLEVNKTNSGASERIMEDITFSNFDTGFRVTLY